MKQNGCHIVFHRWYLKGTTTITEMNTQFNADIAKIAEELMKPKKLFSMITGLILKNKNFAFSTMATLNTT